MLREDCAFRTRQSCPSSYNRRQGCGHRVNQFLQWLLFVPCLPQITLVFVSHILYSNSLPSLGSLPCHSASNGPIPLSLATSSCLRYSRASARQNCWLLESPAVPFRSQLFWDLRHLPLRRYEPRGLRSSHSRIGTARPSSIAPGLPFDRLVLNLDEGLTLAQSGDSCLSRKHHPTSSRSRHLGQLEISLCRHPLLSLVHLVAD